mmetsp:Transcript_69260/g.109382  ORF Transcript_69260/g.109382 Transcript_69260/m.109382 type:complete len:913 (-) Transcript_69260:109-2847(-)
MGGCACIRSRDLVSIPLKEKVAVSSTSSAKVHPAYHSYGSDHLPPGSCTGNTAEYAESTEQPSMKHHISSGTEWLVKMALMRASAKDIETGERDESIDHGETPQTRGETPTNSTPVAQEYVQAKFLRWDYDGDGVLNKSDIDAALKPLDLSDEEVDTIFHSFDKDAKGHLDFDDFKRLFENMPEDRLPRDSSRSIIPGVPDANPPAPCFEPTLLSGDILNGIKPGSLGILIIGAENVPKMDWWSESDPYVVVEVFHRGPIRVASSRTYTIPSERNPTWNQLLSLPAQETGNARASVRGTDLPCDEWDHESTYIKFTLFDEDYFFDDFIGECTMPLLEIIEKPVARLVLWDKHCEAVLGSSPPCMPCEIAVSIIPTSMPVEWKSAHAIVSSIPRWPSEKPYHVFMMTRGTRGDVQPFVALARGLAEELGWMVTICTELRWKRFVKSNAQVSRGKIRFRPSGGDTELKMQGWLAQWALHQKSELLQMTILACSEREFFSSATVFVRQLLDCANENTPVDLVVFGLTVARVAALISELFEKPLIGFILQPSCIPSTDDEWPAVQPLHPESTGKSYTSHKSLNKMKVRMENSRFAKYNVEWLRKSFGLPIEDTYRTMRLKEVPLIIPMREDTFTRPTDWWDAITLTDFIFLRNNSTPLNRGSTSSLGSSLDTFLSAAAHDNAKVCLMTFSSMHVTRKLILSCAVKMIEECRFGVRLIYVGKRNEHDHGPHNLESKARQFTNTSQFLELERADFGLLFKFIDCFIVHGGLGTTVEALRLRKPCCVTGPLLLDQRFWGNVCHQKGVGPEPVHIDSFESHCVNFVNGALDPSDPYGWQANALSHDWGLETDDGVSRNVRAVQQLIEADGSICSMSSPDFRRDSPRIQKAEDADKHVADEHVADEHVAARSSVGTNGTIK